jgi:phosphoserine phosphatase RsbU/P
METIDETLVDDELMRRDTTTLISVKFDSDEPRIVLVVEDEDVALALLSRCLQKIGCKVVHARNGKEALEVMQTIVPHLILLDSAMPIMNGAKFRQLQLRDFKLSKIPTVLVSAIDDAERKKGILANLHFLAKPVSIDHLVSTVQYFVCNQPTSNVL